MATERIVTEEAVEAEKAKLSERIRDDIVKILEKTGSSYNRMSGTKSSAVGVWLKSLHPKALLLSAIYGIIPPDVDQIKSSYFTTTTFRGKYGVHLESSFGNCKKSPSIDMVVYDSKCSKHFKIVKSLFGKVNIFEIVYYDFPRSVSSHDLLFLQSITQSYFSSNDR